MLIPLDKIINVFDLKIKGVLHIGAHWGEEYDAYYKQNIKNLIFFEPIKSNYEMLIDKLPDNDNIKVFNIALGNGEGEKEMFTETANRGQSCSFLEPLGHLKSYPHIKFDRKEVVNIDKLDNIPFDRSLHNMINIDVQGYELEVFKGGMDTIGFIDIIYAEVNFNDVYKDCCKVTELDSFLGMFGFDRVLTETKYSYLGWGDALYLKT